MSQTKSTSVLKRFDVVGSDKFCFGMRYRALYDEAANPIEVGLKEPAGLLDASDETRAQARFVVLSTGLGGNTEAFGGPNDTWWEVIAQRLSADGAYDPQGEIIKFKSGAWDGNIDEVNYLGRMALTFVSAE